jgi:hypothetical protein
MRAEFTGSQRIAKLLPRKRTGRLNGRVEYPAVASGLAQDAPEESG